jgi:hypothetical protein
MATYEQWNERLFNYVTSGIPRGARVYLAIDDEVIEYLATQLGTKPSDFSDAVRLKCVRNNAIDLNRIFSQAISQNQYKERPRYLAFLSLMVLAAYHMGESEELGVSGIDYFYYFNSLIGFPKEAGRPTGMAHGTEEKLWNDWSIWLKYQGFQPTAVKVGDHYFTYARSQALLRQSDKNNLWKFFSNNSNKFEDDINKDDLVIKLTVNADYGLTKHLKEILSKDGKVGAQRYEDLSEALIENFEFWIASGRQAERAKAYRKISKGNIMAGLYRIEDFISHQPQFYILAKQPRYIQVSDLSVSYKGRTDYLELERPGWFEPLPWQVDFSEIENGLVVDLKGNKTLTSMILPKRDFWILSPDPDDTSSGIYASWEERTELGIPFVLLIKKNFESDLIHLKNEGLITWKNQPTEINGWYEYKDVVVISDAWSNVSITNKSLLHQFRPRGSISISLRGGLRDPHKNAWLVNHGPEILINSFFDDIELEILRTGEDDIFKRIEVKSGEITQYKWDSPGNYQLRIRSGEEIRERQVTILDWTEISLAKPGKHKPIQIGTTVIYGALIEKDRGEYD